MKDSWLEQQNSPDERMNIEWALQNARVVGQAAHLAYEHSITYRDSCMAENIGWILDQHPAAKAVVWTHDTHICFDAAVFPALNYNEGVTMGTFLHNRYGADYRAFGFSTYQGTYSSTVSYTDFRRVINTLYPSPPGSFDEALHRIAKRNKTPCLIADLRPFLHKPFAHWLQQNRPVRFITYATSDYGYEQYVSLPSQFDAVIFIDRTQASKKITH